jgi:uncharacterized membrane protein
MKHQAMAMAMAVAVAMALTSNWRSAHPLAHATAATP